MKAYVAAPSTTSRAMFRVANALERFAPQPVRIVQDPRQADLVVMHVIGLDAVKAYPDRNVAVIQYCGRLGLERDATGWSPLWSRARLVWSYYDLVPWVDPSKMFLSPLGIDNVFTRSFTEGTRDIGVITSGAVNGHGQEAIEEPILAAQAAGMRELHISGPVDKPVGFTREFPLRHTPRGIGDTDLAGFYRRAKWVAALRYGEGFELPAIEGLACGARPIVFDREDMRRWYWNHAMFVPEASGEALIESLTSVMREPPRPVSAEERAQVLARFNWKTIIGEFWRRILT